MGSPASGRHGHATGGSLIESNGLLPIWRRPGRKPDPLPPKALVDDVVARQIRQAAGLTQAELAELGGTSQPSITAYETGNKSPNPRMVLRLAEIAGLDLHFTVTASMTREDGRSSGCSRRSWRIRGKTPTRSSPGHGDTSPT